MTVALPETQDDLWQRLDAAEVLKRFHLLERTLCLACAGWVPAARRLETKAALGRAAWQNSLTGDALRERVFELRYPSRLVQEGTDAPLVRLYDAALHAPGPAAFLRALAELLLPALREGYARYLEASDALADAPSQRFLALALEEKAEQAKTLAQAARAELELAPAEADDAEAWLGGLRTLLASLGRVGLEAPAEVEVPEVVAPGRRFALAQEPGRDPRYLASSIYWPDVVDPGFPYGEGVALQVRSAVSHLNEVWAVDTAGAILQALAPELGWEFVRDAARWLYDECRHMLMGVQRLAAWGLEPAAIPLGGYIYEACRDQDPIYRIGMLGLFETKNIGKKRQRAEAFHGMGDLTSERHMEFDWADETIHAEYGRRWLKRLLELRGGDESEYPAILEHCQELVAERLVRATPQEKQRVGTAARALLRQAEARAAR